MATDAFASVSFWLGECFAQRRTSAYTDPPDSIKDTLSDPGATAFPAIAFLATAFLATAFLATAFLTAAFAPAAAASARSNTSVL